MVPKGLEWRFVVRCEKMTTIRNCTRRSQWHGGKGEVGQLIGRIKPGPVLDLKNGVQKVLLVNAVGL